ncbi:MAG: Tol-Pal system beta propeller repeat protein TolB [Endomicrobia bacterium]|nr:Tol-Pal system beta propeller repeat protein TolB [Endomicrobiia bacterium]MCL2506503.1 Tol-Pal system beta propeller repeat protein TolB [Endomicrobiia bacterium]
MNSNIEIRAIKKIFFVLFVLCVCKVFAYAQSDVYLSLSAIGKRSDIAIETFVSGDRSLETLKASRLLQEIVENDLILSRYFNIIKGDPEVKMTFKNRLVFWDQKGATALLTATVKLEKNMLTIIPKLYDVITGEVIWQHSYSIEVTDYRLLAHEVSDEVVRRFTGEDGIARSKIVFINNSTRFKELYVIDYDGHNLRRLTKDNKLNVLPKWAPSGEQVIYTSYLYDNPDLFSLDLIKNRRSVISKYQGLNAAGAYSPDGERIALTLSRGRFPNLFLINRTGEILRRMTDGTYIDTSPSFAPNGQEIVFISDRPGYPQLYIMNVDGGNIRRLTTNGHCDSPAWSPRGDKIVFTMRQPRGNYDLYVYDLPTSKITKITNNQRNNENPTWSPDGRFVTFASSRSGKSEIYIMAIDGSGTRKLAEIPGSSYSPAWSPVLKRR